ncbi:MAG: AgmX/PglI C-terminal domain-containing protein [Polyangiaceae bacterium]
MRLSRSAASVALVLAAALTPLGCDPAPPEPRVPDSSTPESKAFPRLKGAPDRPTYGFVGRGSESVRVRREVVAATVAQPVAWATTEITVTNEGAESADGMLEASLAGSTFAVEASLCADRAPCAVSASARDVPVSVSEIPGRARALTVHVGNVHIEPGKTVTLALRYAATFADGSLTFGAADVAERQVEVVDEQGARVGAGPSVAVDARDGASFDAGLVKFETRAVDAGPTAPPPEGALVLLDTSAARAHDLDAELRALLAVRDELGNARLVVAAYDQTVDALYDGPAAGLGPRVAEALAARAALGAADPIGALRWAYDKVKATQVNADGTVASSPVAITRVLVVTDGVRWSTESEKSRRAIASLGASAPVRVDVVLPAGHAHVASVAAITELGGEAGLVAPLYDPSAVAALLRSSRPTLPEVGVAGWPALPRLLPKGRAVLAFSKDDGKARADVPAWVVRSLLHPDDQARSASFATALAGEARPFPDMTKVTVDIDPLDDSLEKKPATKDDRSPTVTASSPPPNDPLAPTSSDDPPAPAAEAGRLPAETIRDIVHKNFGRFRGCYRDALRRSAKAAGRIVVKFDIDVTGAVLNARAVEAETKDTTFIACTVGAFIDIGFPASPTRVTVSYPIQFKQGDADGKDAPAAATKPNTAAPTPALAQAPKDPWQGEMKRLFEAAQRGDLQLPLADPAVATDAVELLLQGDLLAAKGDTQRAARAYGTLVALGGEPEVMRAVAGRLSGTRVAGSTALAGAALEAALDRGFDPITARELALVRAEEGDLATALRLLDATLSRGISPVDFPGLGELVRHDLGALAATLVARDPSRKRELERWLADVGVSFAEGPSLAVSASWDSLLGAGELDLSVADVGLSRAQKGAPALGSGGRLLADCRRSSGVEAFVLEQASDRRAYPYTLFLDLVPPKTSAAGSSSPTIVGNVEALDVDGSGGLVVSRIPFMLNVPGGRLELGKLERPKH